MNKSLTKSKSRYGKVITARPNWSSKATEVYSFQTRIWRSRDITEQRVAQRQKPRLEFSFRRDASGSRARQEYREIQNQYNDEPSILPVRWRSVPAQNVVVTNTDVNLLGPAPWWAVHEGWVVIESDDAIEAHEVWEVSGSTVTIATIGGAQYDHTSNVRLHWGVAGFVSDRRRLRSIVSNHTGGTLDFEVKPGAIKGVSPTPDVRFYNEQPILLQRPNWAESVSMDIEDYREVIDYGTGPSDEYYFNQFGKITLEYVYTAMNRSDVDDLIAFFCDRRGRQKPFWAYSHQRDFGLLSMAPENSTNLQVEGDYSDFDEDRVHAGVMVTWPDGARQLNSIAGTSDGYVTVSDGWLRDVTEECVISWAYYCCFASDNLEIEWVTDSVAEVSIGLVAIPESDVFPGAGGEFYETTFEYGKNNMRFWEDAGSWGQVDLGRELTAADVAAGDSVATATYSGEAVESLNAQEVNGSVATAFFNAAQEKIGGGQDWSWSEPTTPLGEVNPFDKTFPEDDTAGDGIVILTEGTRYVRFGGLVNQSSQNVSGTGTVTVVRATQGGLL